MDISPITDIPGRDRLLVHADSSSFTDDVVERVRAYGVAFVPGWLRDVKSAADEFDTAFRIEEGEPEGLTDTGKNLSRRYGRTVTGEQLKLTMPEVGEQHRDIAEIFRSPALAEIANGYLGKPNTLNRWVILTNDYRAADEILDFHFDDIGTLKFLVYLDDVDENNGPFEAIPGTHLRTRDIRIQEWLRLDDYNKIRFKVFSSFSEELFYVLYGQFKMFMRAKRVQFTGPAGSLAVFDTDTLHRAGHLAEGKHRRVARSSTYRGFYP
ncbi:phytanoyl-CoA dioxygenase family protein [Streptomyces sp. NPDC057746]|uniref:phytanoyl-CoA dioxygenase family protein n=1 Tax=Streptomyces sp. NPDC057746 TaxID=3346237 RepID=UPI0036B35527